MPEAHFLETWSDARSSDGTVAIQQPMIRSMYGGKTPAEMVALLTGGKDQKAYDIVKNYWLPQLGEKTDEAREMAWRKALNDGLVASVKPAEPVKVSADAKKIAAGVAAEPKAGSGGIEVAFFPSASTWDGRFANNGWMQEAPDPITKLIWGNAAMISPAMARAQNLTDGDIITICRGQLQNGSGGDGRSPVSRTMPS